MAAMHAPQLPAPAVMHGSRVVAFLSMRASCTTNWRARPRNSPHAGIHSRQHVSLKRTDNTTLKIDNGLGTKSHVFVVAGGLLSSMGKIIGTIWVRPTLGVAVMEAGSRRS